MHPTHPMITLAILTCLNQTTNFGAQTTTTKSPVTIASINTGKTGLISKYEDNDRILYIQAQPKLRRFSYYEIDKKTKNTNSKTVVLGPLTHSILRFSMQTHRKNFCILLCNFYEHCYQQLQNKQLVFCHNHATQRFQNPKKRETAISSTHNKKDLV